jgi:MFS family permease
VATAWPVVLAGRGGDRVGKGIRGAPRDALLMVDVPADQRGRVFGFHRAADTAGAVVGPAMGLGLYELLDHRIRPLLVVAVVPAVLSVLLVAVVREGAVVPAVPRVAGEGGLSPQLRRLIALLTVFGLVNIPDALLLLRAHDLGLSTGGVLLAYIAYNIVYAVGAYPAGALSDRLPRHLVFAVGLGLFAVGYIGLGLATQSWLVFVFLPLYGGFAACTDGVGKAWIASLAPTGAQARAQGTYQGLSGGAVLVAGLWAGLAWGGNGAVPLTVAGLVAAFMAVVMVTHGRAFIPA